MQIPTVHNSANFGDIAESILLPGDPLRAKFIAENFLTDAVLYTQIRGILGYTGTYKGERISVQGTGMGGPSMGIYAHELIHAYGVKRLIRVGSAGAIQDHLKIGDLIGASATCYDTNYSNQWEVGGTVTPAGSFHLLHTAQQKAQQMQKHLHVGVVLSSDLFYHPSGLESLSAWKKVGVLAVEMEAASLYMTAQVAQVDAVCLLTVSDLPFSGEEMSAKEREQSLVTMIELGLEVALHK
ncbi:MAG: purine-nucleoside phosphorylase [Sphaerochaetaceae bacterium]|nr:purine-nucleoside phosphorylase [Sphaerochaetaceae bacterium]